MNLSILQNRQLTSEQLAIIKQGLADSLQFALNYRGVRGEDGRPIPRYAFLKKRQIRKIKTLKVLECKNGRKIYVRSF